ncbi:conserved hypothetical protein [Mycoplasma haemofelis str. Langford 1]|uniref:RNA polymerasefactor sigma-70, ECF subfamily n=2 Tax=Mycoplasma haemofelis TaxID=29501 RepID=F6FFI5_MYCHI|nr:sigma-70 family RNA polymerase sigma factor [Mycoplasma haemofelis]AEG72380.1 RNA polymerasefactor sigma-70, ECF subfamily [Mycoplasma haemofelis Ohio2]CBY92066.1 conserved hypothetical protein [Mycoplasma haemofelis str. Langford 1]
MNVMASEINKLIIQFQQNKDVKALNTLLEIYYVNACKWANQYIRKCIYSNLIKFEPEEINSYVYISFLKAVETYKISGEKRSMSFKNYFYQLIKYQTYSEIRGYFNWQIIPKYAEMCKRYEKDAERERDMWEEKAKSMDVVSLCEEIFKFLLGKNETYAKVFKYKMSGYKNSVICEKLGLSPNSLKAMCQYIKKLILKKFGRIDILF